METPPENRNRSGAGTATGGGISQVDDYILQTILSKLPAKSLASAACVSRTWNNISTRILLHPNFISVISLKTSLHEAVKEVMFKVLSAPIRPQFAILTIFPYFNIDEAHALVVKEMGTRIPVITCAAAGVIGRNALNDVFSEVKFPDFNEDYELPSSAGISLTVGYFPGLKVDAFLLSDTKQGPDIDKFVMDVRGFSASVSGCTSPAAIIMFGDNQADMKPVLEKFDCALYEQTIIAGNESCSFRHSTHRGIAVALVFARDKTTSNGQGKIEFHFAVGAGVSAVGPIYRVNSVKKRSPEFTTWLTARREGQNVVLDGEQMLNDLEEEMEHPLPSFYDLYIGVNKRRKYGIGSEHVKTVTSLAFHPVQEADEQYLYVGGWDIKTGDTLSFYVPDIDEALNTCSIVSENFGKLKHKEMIGGFVFACCGRGESFFHKPNVDSSPILDNFPDIPLGGMYCGAEIGRGSPNLGQSDNFQEQDSTDSRLHVYSSIYLLVSYNPHHRP